VPRKRGYPPVLKRFGQHFLTDRKVLEGIADAVQLTPKDTVVEIGPGRGALTSLLLARAARVIAVEIDRELAALLRKRHAGDSRLTVVEADVLSVRIADVVQPPFAVAGNVPYYITTPILFHVLKPPLPDRAVFLVQREVADRIVSEPGSREYGALSVNVQAIARAEIVRFVPPESFSPPPKVDSAVVRLVPLSDPLVPLEQLDQFRVFVQAIFGMRRKQMANVLRSVANLSLESAAKILEAHGIDREARPETLSPAQFALLTHATH
jgi:16S rRNA (adenine1518-N6/adenine1519-N6)-dimethyltransferase